MQNKQSEFVLITHYSANAHARVTCCKSSKGNGGGAQNIVFRDSALKNITEEEGEPFIFTSLYPKEKGITATTDGPIFQNITVENCTVNTSSGSAIFVAGLSSAWHQN